MISNKKKQRRKNLYPYCYEDIMKKWDNNEITIEQIKELIKKDLIDLVSIHKMIFNGPLEDDLLYYTFHCPISELKEKIAKIKADMQYRKIK